MITCCFTGHRPDKLGGYNLKSKKNILISQALTQIIEEIISTYNAKTFYFGGALGIDQMTFEIVRKMQEYTYHDIKMILAIPFENQAIKWFNQEDIDRYEKQKKWADEVVYVDTIETYQLKNIEVGIYHPAKMQLRNQYMVDNSDLVIAVWDGSSGGTANCVKYAKKKNKDIVIINPKGIIGE